MHYKNNFKPLQLFKDEQWQVQMDKEKPDV